MSHNHFYCNILRKCDLKKNPQFIVYTDGACSGNPGPGGWGAIVGSLCDTNSFVCELGGSDIKTTNNRMELQAAVAALNYILLQDEVIDLKKSQIQIYTDSVYVIKVLRNGYLVGRKKAGKMPVVKLLLIKIFGKN